VAHRYRLQARAESNPFVNVANKRSKPDAPLILRRLSLPKPKNPESRLITLVIYVPITLIATVKT
jgi:hypothetical protein